MFTPHANDTGAVQPWEYMPAVAGTYHAGQLLNTAGGKVAALSAAATTTPAYLCMAELTVESGQTIPVTRVSDAVIYETELTAEAADAKIGSLLEVSSGGDGVDATAEGTFEITYLEGTTAGAMVRGRFR